MKKMFAVLAVAATLFAAGTIERPDPGITGIIEPPEAAARVVAIKDNDSAAVVPVNGRFSMTLKPGNWTLMIEAVNPYKNHVQSVLVIEGAPTDVGVIRLYK